MSSQIVAIDIITQRARQAAMDGIPATACPYPEGSPAAARWLVEHANAQHAGSLAETE